jgi:hypothetical protein
MDYSENVKASEAADFAYAKWYNQLPDEKKATFFKNAHKMVVDKVTYDVKKENPFSNHADVMMHFIELTQKDAYSPEIFAFIKKTMAEKSEKEWQERFKTMKNELGWTYQQMATFVGAKSGDAIKASINRKLPAFAKLAVCVFEEMKGKMNV